MKKNIVIKGKSVESKFKSIEKILNQFKPRLMKERVIAIPDIPMANYVDHPNEKGVLFKWILFKGLLVKGALHVGNYNTKNGVKFSISLSRTDGGISQIIETRKKTTISDINIDILDGDLLTISVLDPKTEEGLWKVEDVWCSILLRPSFLDCDKRLITLDELSLDELDEDKKVKDEGI